MAKSSNDDIVQMIKEKMVEKNEIIREQQIQIQELQTKFQELELLVEELEKKASSHDDLVQRLNEVLE